MGIYIVFVRSLLVTALIVGELRMRSYLRARFLPRTRAPRERVRKAHVAHHKVLYYYGYDFDDGLSFFFFRVIHAGPGLIHIFRCTVCAALGSLAPASHHRLLYTSTRLPTQKRESRAARIIWPEARMVGRNLIDLRPPR